MNMTLEMRKRVTPFLEEYISINESAYTNGVINETGIKKSIELLVTSNVYDPISLSKDILVNCNTLIPANYIEEILR